MMQAKQDQECIDILSEVLSTARRACQANQVAWRAADEVLRKTSNKLITRKNEIEIGFFNFLSLRKHWIFALLWLKSWSWDPI